MKVVYIPIVLPINFRTFWALGFGTLGLVMLIIALSEGNWLDVTYRNDRKSLVDGDITSVTMSQSLQVVTTTTCYHDVAYPKTPMCGIMQVQFVECDAKEQSLWCTGKNYFVSAFAMLIVAVIGTGLATFAGMYRELVYGPMLFGMGVISGAALVLFRIGANKVTNVGPAYIISYIATVENGSVNVSVGSSLAWAAFGVALIIIASLISSSLLVYRVESRNVAAQNPPRVHVVNMQVAAGGNIAAMAPRPGFVALSRNEFQLNTGDDDDDDLDLIHAPAQPHTHTEVSRPPPTLNDA